MRGRFPEWYLRDNIEKSLRRLGVERIDMFQLHSFMPSALVELDWLETLMKLRREGKIDRIGVSLRDNRPDEGVDLSEAGLVDSIQVIFNLFEQRPRQRDGRVHGHHQVLGGDVALGAFESMLHLHTSASRQDGF